MELRGLGKGGNAPVTGNRCTVVVGSGKVDVLAFQVGADDRVRSDADVVFYNQPTSPEGAVRLTGPGTVTVLLNLLPVSVATVAIAVAAADEQATSPLSAGLDVTLTTEIDGFRWQVEGLGIERAAILAELYRRNGGWKLRNVSAGWEQGLPALFTHFGVAVDEGTEAPAQQTQQVTVPPPLPPPKPPIAAPPIAAPPIAAPTTPGPAIPGPRAAQPSGGRAPLAPARNKGSAKKRIAWAAAVVVAVLAVAGVLGRSPDSEHNTAQPLPAAAPITTATKPTTSRSAAPSPGTTPSSASATVRPTATTALAAQPLLAAPPAVSVVRTALAAQAAAATLQRLRVAGRAPKTGYSRAQFGQAWTDDTSVAGGHNGCDTRNDILRRDLEQITVRSGSHGCAVTSGSLTDPYTGKAVAFSSSKPTLVQIDHVVALSNAWQTGAAALSPVQRQELANDPLNLQATSGAVNQAKSDGDAATWLPPAKAYRCTYVARQVAVKARYGLWVTAAERQAISTVLTGCGAKPATALPRPTPANTRVAAPATTRAPATVAAVVPARRPPATTTTVTTTRRPPTTTVVAQPPAPTKVEQPPAPNTTTEPATTEESTVAADDSVYYKNCTQARDAHVTPLHTGDPGYRSGLDRDHDGIACE